jgi:Protein of unknown function (DUF3363)
MTMAKKDEDSHGFRLQVRKQKGLAKPNASIKKAMNTLWSVVRATSNSRRRALQQAARNAPKPQAQRAAVRVTYVGKKTQGLWKAHGTYLQRESATGKEQAGFNGTASGVEIAGALATWQAADDPRLFKIILSPEFGEGIDMERYTRDVMASIEKDVNAPLEWVAVAHYNTDHPHVHVALRSVTKDDRELHFPKDYIRSSIRVHAQDAATRQLGFRAQRDIDNARQKEITASRVTALDRNIAKQRPTASVEPTFDVIFNPRATKDLRPDRRADVVAMAARLRHLETMGLATNVSPTRWTVAANFTEVLKTAQMAGDRQRTFARQMSKASDLNLPIVAEDWRKLETLKGRILGHGEEESNAKHFMLIEGIDGRIHYLTHRKETEALRADHQLKVNQFVSFTMNRGHLQVKQFGNAEQLLTNAAFLESQPLPTPNDIPRPGWLGAYDQAIVLHHLAKEPIIMSTSVTVENKKPLYLSPQQVSQYLAETNVNKDQAQQIVNMIESRQKFNMDIEGISLDYNEVQMGGQEGLALYANVSEEEREAIMAKLAIDDTAVEKEQRIWIEQQAREREAQRQQRELEAEDGSTFEERLKKQLQPQEQDEIEDIGIETFGGEAFQVAIANELDQQYKGEIVGMTDNYLVMKHGEDLVLHSKDKIDRIPDVGKRVDIQYTSPEQKANVTTLASRGLQKEIEL